MKLTSSHISLSSVNKSFPPSNIWLPPAHIELSSAYMSFSPVTTTYLTLIDSREIKGANRKYNVVEFI